MPSRPFRLLGTATARLRGALAVCLIVSLAIVSIGCLTHPRTAGHSHSQASGFPPHAHIGAETGGDSPQVPDSAETCVPFGRPLAEARQAAPAHTPAAALPAPAGVEAVLPAVRYPPALRRLAANTGRSTLISVCRWRV
ncbi:hypothetical protein [Streptomyces sp. NPDC051567]|uniref:hypothetical protein n=1 Tax=Streptomyces sp. NPDC051567 TaxID=3365660 RepID=UPI0037BCD07E